MSSNNDAVGNIVLSLPPFDTSMPTAAVGKARSLYRICSNKRIGVNDRAIAAISLQVALESAKFPADVQPELIRVSSIDTKTYLKALKLVRNEHATSLCKLTPSRRFNTPTIVSRTNSTVTTPNRVSIGSLCVKFGLNAIKKDCDALLAMLVRDLNQSPADLKLESEVAVFWVCARAHGAKNIKVAELISLGALSKPYFQNVVDKLENDYSTWLKERTSSRTPSTRKNTPTIVSNLPSRRTPSKSSCPSVNATPQRNTPSRGPAVPASNAVTPAEHEIVDDTELDLLLVLPPTSAPPMNMLEAASKMTTPSGSTRKVARYALRSAPNTATPSGKRKRRREVDECEESPAGNGEKQGVGREVDEAPHKRHPFIGRQSMINWQDDAGTSKKMMKAKKWLSETRELVKEKLEQGSFSLVAS